MKPLPWAFHVLARTVRGVRPDWARPDDAWAEARLSGAERALYRSMDPRDRDHAVRVAKRLLRRTPDAPALVVRAALLHDVGKSRRPYRVSERILVHLFRLAPPPADPPLQGVRGARQVAAHHPEYGAAMIRAAGGNEEVARLVASHERPGVDRWARALWEADRRT